MTLSCCPQDRQHHHLGEALAKAVAGVLFAVEIDDFPTQPRKLIEEGLLNVVALVEFEMLGCFLLGHLFPSVIAN